MENLRVLKNLKNFIFFVLKITKFFLIRNFFLTNFYFENRIMTRWIFVIVLNLKNFLDTLDVFFENFVKILKFSKKKHQNFVNLKIRNLWKIFGTPNYDRMLLTKFRWIKIGGKLWLVKIQILWQVSWILLKFITWKLYIFIVLRKLKKSKKSTSTTNN